MTYIPFKNLKKNFIHKAVLCAVIGAVLSLGTPCAHADTTTSIGAAPRVLQQALASHDDARLYDTRNYDDRLSFSGGLFSGRASGVSSATSNFGLSDNTAGHSAEMEDDTRVYALMLDGKYSFDDSIGGSSTLHPYLSSGVGVAVYDHGAAPTAANLGLQSGGTVPLFRVGAGMTYDLGQQWNMSVDYKAGFSGGNAPLNAAAASGADMQSVNMGMHFKF